MKKHEFKEGDWCFCEFKLQLITKMEDGRITEVSDGICSMSSHDLSSDCYPLSMPIKQVSDEVAYWSKEIHAMNCNSLNYPSIHNALIRRWIELCENINNVKAQAKLYDSLADFGNDIKRRVRDLRLEEVNGVTLFR